MRRHLIIMCIVVAGWLQAAHAAEPIRPKLACFPLAAKTIDAMAYNEQISSLLLSALDRCGAVQLVERKKIEAVIEQHGLRLDSADQKLIRAVGGEAGFNFILTGALGRNEGKLILDLTLIGTSSTRADHCWKLTIGDGELSSKIDEITAAVVTVLRDYQNELTAAPANKAAVLVTPKDLQGTGTARSIRLKWNQPSAENVAGYKVFRATSTDGAYSDIGSCTITSFTDDNLELNDHFYYKVKALGKEGGESEFSPPIEGATVAGPQAPVLISVEPGVRSAALSWYQRPAAGGDAKTIPVKYRVYRAAAEGNLYQQVAELDQTATAYTDATLAEGGSYRYYVTSVNSSGGESEQSAILQVAISGKAAAK
jgi:TolB-like protein